MTSSAKMVVSMSRASAPAADAVGFQSSMSGSDTDMLVTACQMSIGNFISCSAHSATFSVVFSYSLAREAASYVYTCPSMSVGGGGEAA